MSLPLESQDLRIFKCVAEQKSISKAAAILGYVQPNVSGRIKHLEEELDTKLLSRTNRGVTLTDEGVLLLEYTEKILFLMDEVKAKMKEGKGEGSLTIGASQTISAFKIPHFLSDFLKQNKNIKVKVKTDTKQILQEQLLYGEIDGLFLVEITMKIHLKKFILIVKKLFFCLVKDMIKGNHPQHYS